MAADHSRPCRQEFFDVVAIDDGSAIHPPLGVDGGGATQVAHSHRSTGRGRELARCRLQEPGEESGGPSKGGTDHGMVVRYGVSGVRRSKAARTRNTKRATRRYSHVESRPGCRLSNHRAEAKAACRMASKLRWVRDQRNTLSHVAQRSRPHVTPSRHRRALRRGTARGSTHWRSSWAHRSLPPRANAVVATRRGGTALRSTRWNITGAGQNQTRAPALRIRACSSVSSKNWLSWTMTRCSPWTPIVSSHPPSCSNTRRGTAMFAPHTYSKRCSSRSPPKSPRRPSSPRERLRADDRTRATRRRGRDFCGGIER